MDFRIEQAAKEQKAGEGCGQRRDRPNRELPNRFEDEGGHEHEDTQEGYAERRQVEKMSPHAAWYGRPAAPRNRMSCRMKRSRIHENAR